ncbi:MAG: hypothetical protein HY298_09435 [Verrucomicrobia bacterium]|nr:hypothetical protein [Verrucomicrobiota bacterium]
MKTNHLESVVCLRLDAHAKFSLLAWLDDQKSSARSLALPEPETQLIKDLRLIPATTKLMDLEECGPGAGWHTWSGRASHARWCATRAQSMAKAQWG